jgi:hypothetical protein
VLSKLSEMGQLGEGIRSSCRGAKLLQGSWEAMHDALSDWASNFQPPNIFVSSILILGFVRSMMKLDLLFLENEKNEARELSDQFLCLCIHRVRLLWQRFREAGIPFSGHLGEKSCPFKKRILPSHCLKYVFILRISMR